MPSPSPIPSPSPSPNPFLQHAFTDKLFTNYKLQRILSNNVKSPTSINTKVLELHTSTLDSNKWSYDGTYLKNKGTNRCLKASSIINIYDHVSNANVFLSDSSNCSVESDQNQLQWNYDGQRLWLRSNPNVCLSYVYSSYHGDNMAGVRRNCNSTNYKDEELWV